MAKNRSPAPIFNQGPSPLSRIIMCVVLSVLLMAADFRFHVTDPIRSTITTALYPIQWLSLWPVRWSKNLNTFFTDSLNVRTAQEEINQRRLAQSVRVNQASQLILENNQLRALLNLKQRDIPQGTAAEVIYTAPDPYSQRIVINKGSQQNIALGSPVVDSLGLIGQVTRVYLLTSEVTLISDPSQNTPVVDNRSGVMGVISGQSSTKQSLLLQYVSHIADVKVGDILTTNGINGTYPAGIMVAKVSAISYAKDNSIQRVTAQPLSFMSGLKFILILPPAEKFPPPDAPDATDEKAHRKDTKQHATHKNIADQSSGKLATTPP